MLKSNQLHERKYKVNFLNSYFYIVIFYLHIYSHSLIVLITYFFVPCLLFLGTF